MRARARQVQDRLPAAARACALAVDQALVLATPVDTGRARSNWIVRIAQPADEVREALVPGESGSTGAANAAESIAQAQRTISGYGGGTSIHITNNLPYIKRLNEGWSAQAPANFVRIAIQAGIRAVRGFRIVTS